MLGNAVRSLYMKRIIAAITIAQFMAAAPAATFAAGDNLRPSAAKDSSRVYEVRRGLKDGGRAAGAPIALDDRNEDSGFIRVQSNNAGLFRGAQTGGLNTDLAHKQGSNGNLNDHSETRERLEGSVKDMVVAMLSARRTILERLTRDKTNVPKAYRLKQDKIKRNSTLLEEDRELQLKQAETEFETHLAELQPAADKALAELEREYFISDKEQMSRLERTTGLNADNQKVVSSWVGAYCKDLKKIFSAEPLSELVAQITNLVKNQELKADIAFSKAYYKIFGRYPYKVTTLCLGEKKSQYDPNDPTKAWKILERDLRQMLKGISQEDARIIGLRLAYEPRWVIGADTIPADVLAKIDDTHGFIKKISRELLGVELAVDYGAAVKATTIESILALKNVDGVLIGSAANAPATLKPIVEKAVEYVRNNPEKKFNLGINWKANDEANGLKELDAFVAMFKAIKDLDLINITIATPNVTTTRAAMDRVESYCAKVSLTALGFAVARTEDIGNGYETEILEPAAERSRARIESLFNEATGEDDTYLFLKKDGVAFAIAKGNGHDQTLMTVPVGDMTDIKEKEAYYAALLESVSLMTAKTGEFIELIEEKGDRLASYLSGSKDRKSKVEAFSLGALSGTKYWYGRERFFQMEYKPGAAARDDRSTMLTAKPTDRPIARGVSFIIQPTYYVLVNGYGTIGAKAASAARKSGFFVMVTARSVKVDSRDAFLKDYPIVLSDTKNAADFEKNGMQVVGDIDSVLDIADFVIDGTPAKVGADNIKNLYSRFPHLRVILEGGEKAAPGIASFSSGTNYETVRDSQIVRVVSCNTTAMARTFGKVLEQFDEYSENLEITNLLMRRAADPGDEKGENPDGVSLLPVSHHGDDLRAVLSEDAESTLKSLRTTAVVTPTTHFHVHSGTIRRSFTSRGIPLTAARVQAILKAQSRVALVRFPGGELKTPVLFDIFNSMIKDANHPYIVVAQVEESGNPDEVAITIAVPQESNVVPENVNALHAMAGLAGKDAAIRLVDEVLNIPSIKEGLEQRLPVEIRKDGGFIGTALRKLKFENITIRLSDTDSTKRERAVGDFFKLRDLPEFKDDPRIVNTLLDVLKEDRSENVRKTVLSVLGHFPEREEAVDAIIAALSDDYKEVRLKALETLIALKSARAVEQALAMAQTDVYPDIRLKAVEYLGKNPDLKSVDVLISLAENDQYWQIRVSAIQAMSNILDDRVRMSLIDMAVDSKGKPDIRVAAIVGLGRFQQDSETIVPRLITLLNGLGDSEKDIPVSTSVINTLSMLNAVSAEQAILKKLDSNAKLLHQCLNALMIIGSDRSTDLLINIINNKEIWDTTRKSAIDVLEKIKAVQAVNPLIEILRDERDDVEVQSSAARALGNLGDPRAVEPLIRTMTTYVRWDRSYCSSDIASYVRRSCAEALAKLKDPRAQGPLYQVFLNDNVRDVRIEAGLALLEFNDNRAVQSIQKVLSSNTVYISESKRIQQVLASHGVGLLQDQTSMKDGGGDRDSDKEESSIDADQIARFINMIESLTAHDRGELMTLIAQYKSARNNDQKSEIENQITHIIDKVNVFKAIDVKKLRMADVASLNEFLASGDAQAYRDLAESTLLSGKYVPQMLFAGAATRLLKDLESVLGRKLDAREYRMFALDLWAVVDLLKANIDTVKQKNPALAALIEKTATPDHSRHLGMGERHIVAYRILLETLARKQGFDPGAVIQNQKLILHINTEVADMALKRFIDNDYYGFDSEKIFFVIQPSYGGFTLTESGVRYEPGSPALPYGHGDLTGQLIKPDQAFTLDRAGNRHYIAEPILDHLRKLDITAIGTHRVNDLTKFLPDEVVNIEKLAFGLFSLGKGNDIVVELVENPGKQKGGNLLEETDGMKKFLIETSNTKGSPELTSMLKDASEKFAPYNAFRLLYNPDSLNNLLHEGISYNLRFSNGFLYLEAVTGDLTQLSDAKVEAFKKSNEEIHDFKELKQMAEAIQYVSNSETAFDGKDGGAVVETTGPIDYLTLDDVDVKGKTVLYRGDFNSPVENGKLKVTERLKANAVTIRELQQKGARVVIMVHQGRPGDADYLESLDQYAGLVSAEIKAPAGYADDLYGAGAQQAIKGMKNGDVLVLKNVRSWDPETNKKMTLAQQAQSDMVRALSPWIDLEVLDAFSIAHRNNISVVGFQAAGIPLIAGRLMEREIKGNYRAALVGEKPYIASFGGAKIDDYLGVIRKGLKEGTYSKVHMSGLIGELALVAQGYDLGAPTMDFLAEQFKDFSDKKYGNGMEGIVKAIKEILDAYQDRIEIPVDLAYLGADGKRREVLLTEKHKSSPAADTLIGDIGTLTAEKYASQLKEAKTVFVKGPWGNYKNIEFIAASDIIAKALNESGAYLITGGGDTNVLFERLGMTQRINYFSLAGGAFLEFMEGKALPGMVALDRSAKAMLAAGRKLGVSKHEYLKHVIDSKFVYTQQAGERFTELVAAVEKTQEAQKGDLSKALWSAEVIKDSRGKPTVKATLRIGDIIVEGFVPAGTSTGEDEANTVDPSQAVINIMTKIHPMLAEAKLDLGRHEDLVKADRMLQEAAGENFRELGANATLPVSWALWKMAARLHNMPLWLYFQRYEPRAVGKGKVFFAFNFGNGGEHAMKDKSEILGIDRMPFQEILFVTVGAANDRQALAWADAVDAIYKRKLVELAGAENVTRALERGLTAKGVADLYVMTGLLVESGIEAGLRPGVDFQISMDFAANSIYNPETGLYFVSEKEQLTAPELRKYIVKYHDTLTAKYHPSLFLSDEDPLAENEWEQMTQLTAELEYRHIRTVGDDLFVTQIRRVAKGVDNRAANTVLIKPNQNGTIIGTIDTMDYSLRNGMEDFASHRSGETLDPALMDLAKGFRVLAIKTGAPQPESEYPNPQDWERRNKYLRAIEIQEEETQLQKAIIVGPEFFMSGGSVNALKQALALNKHIQFVIYGEAAESIKSDLADISILTAPTLAGAVTMLKSFDFPAQNIVLVGSGAADDADAIKDIVRIPVKGMATIALAQALNALLADPQTKEAFAAYDKAMADFKVDAAVSEQVDQAIRDEEEFFNKV